MLPYLIAGAIGFGIGKLFENGGETFMAGGRITTNEDLLNSFLTSTKEVKVNNLSTHFNEYDDFLLLRNYYTLIATRKGNDVKITNVKHSKTTSAITNRLKALAEEMGYNVSYVSKFENGGETFMAGGNPNSWSVSDLSDGKYLGYIEFQDNDGEYHNFEIMETDDRLVFGGMTNTGFIESGYIEKDGFSTDETLQSLIEDLEVYYNDGAEYTSQIVFNERMENGGETFMAGGRITKYVSVYVVQGNYGQGFEDLTAHDNRKDAIAEMRVYDDNESYPHRVIQRRVLRTDYEKGKYAGGGGIETLGKNKYKYRDFEFEVEESELNMTAPEFYEGQEIEGSKPSLSEIKSVIADYFDFENRDIEEYPITKDEIKMINKNFSEKEQREIFGMTFFKYDNGGETFMAGGIGEADDKYGGQRNKIVSELKGMKGGLNNKAPYVFLKEGYIYVSAENGDNYADYYEYTIDEKLEDLADRYNTYWDWETAGSIVLAPIDTYAGGGLPKKRRRSASVQYGRSDTSFDKQLTAKPVGYRFTNAKANQLRKDPFTKPTEAQVKKYLGKGIYKENRRNRSDRDRNVKL